MFDCSSERTLQAGYALISDSVVIAMVRAWRRARLSTGMDSLGYPAENILAKAGMSRSNRPPPLPDGAVTDAEIVQTIVEKMPDEMRSAFESYHLALIRNERCRGIPHKARALMLGISISTYWLRKDAGSSFIAEWLEKILDLSECQA